MGTSHDRPPPPSDPWAVFGYLVSGPAFYGVIGWLLDSWVGTSYLFPIGLLFGIGLAMYLVLRMYLHN